MRTSPSFESENSFEDFDSSGHHSVDRSADMDWGVVSTTSSVVHGQTTIGRSDTELIGHGILILDGFDSGSSRHENHSSDLSVPGTDSLPSDVGSLTAENNEELDDTEKAWVLSKRLVFIVGLAIVVSFTMLSGLFIRQHFLYRSAMEQLGEKIQRLEQEREEISQPPWIDEKMDENDASSESSFFTLLDNCWIKAKMNVKFGDCSQYSLGMCGAYFENATQSINKWFDETFLSSNGEDSSEGKLDEEQSSLQDAFDALAKFPSIMGEALTSASKVVAEKLATLNLAIDGAEDAEDDLIRASEDSESGAVASELKDLVGGPIKFLSEALTESSQPTQKDKVLLEGLRIVAKSLSSASIGWSEALIQTGETLSIKVGQFIDDPLSYFEFKTDVPSEAEA